MLDMKRLVESYETMVKECEDLLELIINKAMCNMKNLIGILDDQFQMWRHDHQCYLTDVNCTSYPMLSNKGFQRNAVDYVCEME